MYKVRYESILIRTEPAKQQGLTANGPEFLLTAAKMRHLLNADAMCIMGLRCSGGM